MFVIVSIASSAVVFAGCGGDATPDVTTTQPLVIVADSTTTTATLPVRSADAVFEMLQRGTSVDLASIAASMTPGSSAETFLSHRYAVAVYAEAAAEVRSAYLASTTTTSGESTTMPAIADSVETTTTIGMPCGEPVCATYSDPVFDEDGLLRSFSIDGVAVENRVIGPGPVAVVESVQARVVSGYAAPNGVTTIRIAVTAAEHPMTIFGFATVHRPLAAGSPAIETRGAWGDLAVEAGASTEFLVAFDDTTLDGDLAFTAVTVDGVDVNFALPLITP